MIGRGLDVKVDPQDLIKLMRDLKALEDGKPQAAALRKNVKAAGDSIAGDVKSGYSWSSRGPGAVSVGASFAKKGASVFIKVNSRKAPHLRPFENLGNPGVFRHRVFGTDTWVAQQARPTIFPRTERRMDDVERVVAEAMYEAAKAAGFIKT